MSILAKKFLEKLFHDVWVSASLENFDLYYSKNVTGIFDGEQVSRNFIKSIYDEKITLVNFPEVIAEGNKIYFRVQLAFIDEHRQEKQTENIMIYHLDDEGKIRKIWKRSGDILSN